MFTGDGSPVSNVKARLVLKDDPSNYFEVELKSSTGRPTELQKHNIKLTNAANGIGIILYPEGFEQFKTIVKGVTECNSHIQDLTALKAANSNTKCVILQ